MIKNIIYYTTIIFILFGLIFSGCSKSEDPQTAKEPLEQGRNEVADEITNRIQDPIDKARAVKALEDARIEDQAQIMEE